MDIQLKLAGSNAALKKISLLFTGVECSIRNTPKNAKVLVSQNF